MTPIAITFEEGGAFYAPDVITRFRKAGGKPPPGGWRIFAVFFDDGSVFDPILGRMDQTEVSRQHIRPELDDDALRLLVRLKPGWQ